MGLSSTDALKPWKQRLILLLILPVSGLIVNLLSRNEGIASLSGAVKSKNTTASPTNDSLTPSPLVVITPKIRPVDENNRTIFDTTFLRQRAARLRQEAVDIRSSNVTQPATNKVHIFSYASPDWNLTLERLVLEVQRSGLYESVRPFGPEDLEKVDPEFVGELQEILSLPRGGGYWLWKFPLLEYMLKTVPLGEVVFYIDSGSTVLSGTTGRDGLNGWLDALNSSPDREILRFYYPSGRRQEVQWCVSRMFRAFNLTCDGPDQWSQCYGERQMPATLFLGRNGAAMRETLAMIYDALSYDPWIITDVYWEETKRALRRQFNENRHDQCLLSISSKLLQNYVMSLYPNHDLGMRRHRTVQCSRVSGKRLSQPGNEIDPVTFSFWKKECSSNDTAKDLFCDELALRLHKDDRQYGGVAEMMQKWNISMDDASTFLPMNEGIASLSGAVEPENTTIPPSNDSLTQPPLVVLGQKIHPVDENNRTIFDTTFLRQRAARLRQEAVDIRSSNVTQPATNKVHIFSYASPDWNLTLERLVLEVQRSGLYESVRPFGPEDLEKVDPEFVGELQEILSLPRGGGYWLWKFPLLEYMLKTVPLGEVVFYIDSGSTVLSGTSGREGLNVWLDALNASPDKDLIRFYYASGRRQEAAWCVSRMFRAFNLTCDGPDQWPSCYGDRQMPATLFLGRNGAAMRETLAMIYDALSYDPWIITDVYWEETKKVVARFQDNRHDQCLLSISSKLLNNFVLFPSPDGTLDLLPESRTVQCSRIKGNTASHLGNEIEPITFAFWKKECSSNDTAKDLFCDELALRLHRDALKHGVVADMMQKWNISMDDVYDVKSVMPASSTL